jgi:hypothetical protein
MNITSKIVALSSAVAFALQIALALLMLRYFSPEEVGMFSVISQIGFFWTTLALAQTPLRLLANHGASVFEDARHAWVSSLQRFVWLSPLAGLAVWCSGLSFVNALLWALLLSLFQLTWMLAQSMRLRMLGAWAQVGVRVLPPLVALLVTLISVHLHLYESTLLLAALFGYIVGATWFLPVVRKSQQYSYFLNKKCTTFTLQELPTINDDRSTTLRMFHSFSDILVLTTIIVVWQRLYGLQETGCLTALLRMMGFIPAVIHMAWSQVRLARSNQKNTNPFWLGLAGFGLVTMLGVIIKVAIDFGYIREDWQGIKIYIFSLAIWQGSSCMTAAFSYKQFQKNKASKYSWLCIILSALQLLVLAAPYLNHKLEFPSDVHLQLFAIFSSFYLLVLCYWLHGIDEASEITY